MSSGLWVTTFICARPVLLTNRALFVRLPTEESGSGSRQLRALRIKLYSLRKRMNLKSSQYKFLPREWLRRHDARVLSLPDPYELTIIVLWRENDDIILAGRQNVCQCLKRNMLEKKQQMTPTLRALVDAVTGWIREPESIEFLGKTRSSVTRFCDSQFARHDLALPSFP